MFLSSLENTTMVFPMVSSKEFSKKELVSILEIIEAAQNCVTPGEVSSLLLRTKDLVFADYSVCGMGRLSGGEVKDILAVVNGNYPTEGLYRYDPVVRYHSSFSPTQSWSDIYTMYDDVEARFVVSNAWDFGIRHGISSSIFMPGLENISIFAFAARNDSFT